MRLLSLGTPIVDPARYVVGAAIFLAVYVLLDWASYLHPLLPLGITPWNPPAGLVFVWLLWFGWRALPLAVLAPVVAQYLVRGVPPDALAVAAVAILLALVYWGAAAALRRWLRVDPRLPTARDVACLFAVVLPVTLLAALLHVAVFAWRGAVTGDEWPAIAARYWVGDLNGVLVVAPLLLVWSGRVRRSWQDRWSRARLAEWLLQGALLAGTLWVIFGLAYTDEFKFFYLLFVPMVWITLRHGLPGATLAIALTQAGLILAVEVVRYETTTFMEFQVLMLALACTALLLGAVVSERRRARADLLAQQAALNRALQFAVAGEMTAALAHEVNNPIGALTTYLHALSVLLERAPSADARVQQTLAKALAEGRRAGDVIISLRNLYASERPRGTSVEAGVLCRGVVEQLLPAAERQGVRLTAAPCKGGVTILADPSQVFIVLRNLADNAVAAAASGWVPREVVVGAQPHGRVVRFTVEDTGAGLALAPQDLAFAPLSSTKLEGMGLGLAIAKRIVDAHGGTIWAERLPGRGTRFTVELPSAA
jgi:two-component system, LuxR family, sensor kinase FixL